MDEKAKRERLEWYKIRDELGRQLEKTCKQINSATLSWLLCERDVIWESIGRLDRNAIPPDDGCLEGWSDRLHEYLKTEEGKEALEDIKERAVKWRAALRRVQQCSLLWLKQEHEETASAIERLESELNSEGTEGCRQTPNT